MARQELKPGNLTLDVLTRDELEEVLQELLSGYLRPPDQLNGRDGAATDANGALTVNVQPRVKAGMRAVLTRVLVATDVGAGSDPGNPYTHASGYVELQDDEGMVDFVSLVSGQGSLPQVWTWSESHGIRIRPGGSFKVMVADGPASTGIVVRFWGTLEPLPPEL